jgi:tripartite-type tricarboxylate transporter receptor subunit TctC
MTIKKPTEVTPCCSNHSPARLPAFLALGLASAPAPAQQDYPRRPITLIVPFAAGGPTDMISRIVGYTIITGHMGTHAAAVGLYPNLAYNPETDFEPIGLVAGTPILILARKDFPPKDLKEFITYVKANAHKLNEAHAGVGSVSFTTCTLLNSLLAVQPTRVPYTGTGPSMNALVAGQVDYMCDQIVNAVPQILGGTIKAYAIATPERNPSLPNVPTTTEAGLPDFQVSAWNALFAPKGTPQAIIDKLNGALVKALDDEATRKRLLDLGSDIPGGDRRTPQALRGLVKSEVARWTPILTSDAVGAK